LLEERGFGPRAEKFFARGVDEAGEDELTISGEGGVGAHDFVFKMSGDSQAQRTSGDVLDTRRILIFVRTNVLLSEHRPL
jgi:hypothetical protein